jgi:hypothetical protein
VLARVLERCALLRGKTGEAIRRGLDGFRRARVPDQKIVEIGDGVAIEHECAARRDERATTIGQRVRRLRHATASEEHTEEWHD